SDATLALLMTFLLGMHAMLWQEPPIHLRSTAAVRCPSSASVHPTILPPVPPPKMMFVKCSVLSIISTPHEIPKFNVDISGANTQRFKRSDLTRSMKMPLGPARPLSGETTSSDDSRSVSCRPIMVGLRILGDHEIT